MAIRLIIPTAHVPQGTATGSQGSGYGLANAGLATNPVGGNVGTVTAEAATIGDGASGIRCRINGANFQASQAYWQLPVSSLTDGVSDTSYIGFSLKAASYSTGQGGAIAMFTVCGIAIYPATLGITPSATADNWIDFSIDRINNKITGFVDGKPVWTSAITAGSYSGANIIQFGGSTAQNWYGFIDYHFSQVYFIDDTKDDTTCTRLGPSSLVLLTPLSVVGSDYTTTDGSTLIAALTAPMNSAASLIAPLINTPPSQQTLDCQYSVAMDQYAQIKAVAFLTTAKKNAGTDTAFRVKLSMAGSTVQGNMLSFADNALKYSQPLGIQNKAPDNTPWTPAKLAACVVSLSPVNLTP